ncbi:MAG: RNA polymerase sigma-70 factor [Bacteroidota bacterium]
MDDKQKLEEVRAGNATVFEQIFREYYSMLCHFAVRYTQDPEEAEEIVQQLFVRIWQKRSEIVISGSFKSYLFQSARNACLNHIKHQKVRLEHHQYTLKTADASSVENTLEVLELENKIQEALDKLPPERQKIFLMSRNEGLKYKEIAEKLNISVKTVENQMGKALKFLRTELIDYLSIAIFISFNIIENLWR